MVLLKVSGDGVAVVAQKVDKFVADLEVRFLEMSALPLAIEWMASSPVFLGSR